MDFNGDVKIYPSIIWQSGQPVMDGGLFSTVYISLFSDAGWFADSALGSRLHALNDRILTNHVKLEHIEETKRALQWLLDDGIATDISVEAEIQAPDFLAFSVTITEPNGNTLPPFKFAASWRETEGGL